MNVSTASSGKQVPTADALERLVGPSQRSGLDPTDPPR